MTKLPEQPLSREVMEMNQPAPTRAYRYYVLAILVIVYMLNFLDRTVLSILAGSIKKEFSLTDAELGLMSGLAFSAIYSVLGIPVAWLADRSSRIRIMAFALAIWSAFTALCGFAQSYAQMFLARVGVGVGEAGGVAPAYSVIADYFPKQQRARALAVYSLGIPLGMACGILFGGLIASKLNWRYAFIIVGAAGVVLAPIFRMTIKDPPRGGYATEGVPVAKAAPPRFAEVASILVRKRTFWLLSFGAAMSSVFGYGTAFWLPQFFSRVREMSPLETTYYYAGITLLGGCVGVLSGGWIADRVGRRSRSAYPLIPSIAFAISVPCFFLAVGTTNMTVAFPLFLIPTALNLMWLGPILTSVQHLVPGHMRTTGSAMFLLINNLVGIGLGHYYFGAVADAFKPYYGDQSLLYSIYTGLGFYVVASILFVIASKTLAKDWVDENAPKSDAAPLPVATVHED